MSKIVAILYIAKLIQLDTKMFLQFISCKVGYHKFVNVKEKRRIRILKPRSG